MITDHVVSEMTVDQWFNQWIYLIKGYRKPKTITNYSNYYNNNIKSVIGNMPITDVKPMHCSLVLQNMIGTYKVSSIKQTRVAMSCMFQYALDNEVIQRNPVGKSVTIPYESPSYTDNQRHLYLTPNESVLFLRFASTSPYYLQFQLVLETGLRASELVGLTYDEIDLDNNTLHIRHTLLYDKENGWYFLTPKSKQGIRDIFMTPKCRSIIKEILQKRKRMCCLTSNKYSNLLFLSRNGIPIRISSYNLSIRKICDKAGMQYFSMHSLRHTFATRCVLAGMSTKVLQDVMGHSDISTTMNYYVHISESLKQEEMNKLAAFETQNNI